MAESNIHPEQEAQKRRSTRIVQAVPLTVTGVDALGRPFQERTSTLIINCHGARYQSKHYVLKNMWVTLDVPHNEPGHAARSVRGRVTWIQRPRTVRELFQIGVELEVGGNVWGIAFPPSDWFPFPEGGAASSTDIPAPSQPAELPQIHEIPVHEKIAEDRVHLAHSPEPVKPNVVSIPSAPEHAEPVEDNVRVLPLPAGEDASLQLTRQVARLVAEAKQQIEIVARESANQAVAAETRPLLAALQSQLQSAAEKSVSAAAAAQFEKFQQETIQRIEKERETAVTGVLEQLSTELDAKLNQARLQIDNQLAVVERTRRMDFEQQIQTQLQAAIHKMESLSGSMGKNQDEVRAVMDQLRISSAQAAADEIRRWKEQMDLRTSEAQARLAEMDQSARKLGEQIAAATAVGEVGWRGLLEADLEAANTRWQEKMQSSIADASQRAAEQIAKNAEVSAQQVEQQLQQRFGALNQAHSQIFAETEGVLIKLRSEIAGEASRGDAVISQFHDSIAELEAKRGDFAALLQSTSDEWARRGEAMLEGQSAELNRRAESAVTGMSQRLQPMLEAAGQESIEKLAAEFENRFSPQITQATELLSKIAFDSDRAEKAAADHQQRIWQMSDQGLQESAARSKEILAGIEKDFAESARNASARWLAELETRATETSHSTFETLYKSADWYEKKIQTQMQTTLEKGMDQAAARLREKAAEMSGLFASELDHYSRSYVEHAHGQMQENARDAAEHASQKMAEAGESIAATFTERAGQLSGEQFDAFTSRTRAAMEQNAAAMDAHTSQIRSNLESDARGFASEFKNALSQHAEQTLALGKQELGLQIDQAKDALLIESQSLERHFQSALTLHGNSALDEHKQRLENASNAWLLTTVTKLNQQSDQLISEMSDATEKKLKVVCENVFSEMGEILRQRLAGLASPFSSTAKPDRSSSASGPAKSEEKQ
ncbi:MAG TPA: hypothetical protein VK709_05980 [Candidatus Saccharimonadales bacterium]|nr:hypothetical protein [Candidatus Saccharimonadales bacterium]